MRLRVRLISRATPDSRIVRLALGRARVAYRAGQAVRLGLSEQNDRRPYSIAGAPEDARALGCLEFLIKVGPDGRFTSHLAGLRRGSLVEVSAPIGSFTFPDAPRERRVLFVAGGAGIAPLRAMLRHALARGYPGHISVLYSARTPRHFAYATELRRLAARNRIDLSLTTTREADERWSGHRGRITEDTLARLAPSPRTLCFVCGPPGFVAEVRRLLGRLGIPPKRIRTERWTA